MLFRLDFFFEFVRAELKNASIRFLSVILSFAIAISLLISLSSFSKSLIASINEDSKGLLGADIVLSRNSNYEPIILKELEGLSYSKEVAFSSMLLNKNNNKSRLVSVRAQSGLFPYYGEVVIDPPQQTKRILQSNDLCLVDESLAGQLGLAVGSNIKLGQREYLVSGIIKKYPGDTYGKTLIAPKVIIPLDTVEYTDLLKKGSRVSYKIYIKNDHTSSALPNLIEIKEKFGFEVETVEDSKKRLGNVFEQVTKYILVLIVLVVALSGVGLYATLSSFIREKILEILTLLCLGASRRKIIFHYLLLSFIILVFSLICSLLFSMFFVYILPLVFSDFLPLTVKPAIDLAQFGKSIFLTLVIVSLGIYFSLLPIFYLHPSQALREIRAVGISLGRYSCRRNFLKTFSLLAAAISSIYIYSYDLKFSIIVTCISVLALVVFNLVINLSRLCIKKINSLRLNFATSYAISMLARKGNGSSVLLSLGFIMLILFIITIQRSSFVAQFDQSSLAQRPNMVLFDVQPDQQEVVRSIVQPFGKIVSESPIVTMRILAINGISNSLLRNDKDIPDWTLKREYRSTFRDHLIEGEKLISGKIIGEVNIEESPIVPITVDQGLADNLKIKLGDVIDFDVQGVIIKAKISGIRKVNWRRVQTNFFFVFPKGVLEPAPYMSAFMISLKNLEKSSVLQNALIEAVPNVSAIDLKLVLDTTDEVLDRIVQIIEFLGIFSFFSGVLILISTLYGTRLERIKESLLLRALGARQVDILTSQTIEFFILSILAIIPSLILSLIINYGVLSGYFDIEVSISYLSLVLHSSILIILILSVGLFFTKKIKSVSLMNVLRE